MVTVGNIVNQADLSAASKQKVMLSLDIWQEKQQDQLSVC